MTRTTSLPPASTVRESLRRTLHEQVPHGKKTFPFAVYHGRIPEWLPGFPLHWHDEFEIIIVSYGSGCVTVQGNRILCRKDDIVLIPPGAIHSILRNGNEHVAYYNIMFSLRLLEENPDSLCSRRYLARFADGAELLAHLVRQGTERHDLLFPLVHELAGLWEKDSEESALLIKARLFEIMHHLRADVAAPAGTASTQRKAERMKRALSFVAAHFAEHISVADAAEACALSPSRFMKVFRQENGMSFIAYLNDYRLEAAAEQLADTGCTVTEAALQNGFGNVSYFISRFRRKFGCSPAAWRPAKDPGRAR